MRHLSEEEIVLHYYGDAADREAAERHLAECSECREEFEKVKNLLAGIPPAEVPEPPPYLEQRVWLNLRDRLEEEKLPVWRRLFSPAQWATAGAVAVLVIAAFLAGHFWQHPKNTGGQEQVKVDSRRVVLVAVGDHLERSQILLIELMNGNAKDSAELASEQEQARDLLDDNRLYRVSAQRNVDPAVANFLDELERVLAEVANAPDGLSADDVQEIRKRIESQDLLFKIHVIGSKVATPATTAAQRL